MPFFSLTITPGEDCKVLMPPCSALEIKHAALVAKPSARCTLECDLATHRFVLCSIPPGGPMQALLSTVVTNDPDQEAWLFLKATGPCAFNVLGRLVVDQQSGNSVQSSNPAGQGNVVSRAELRRRQRKAAAEEDDDAGWPTAADVAPSAAAGSSTAVAPMRDDDDGEENIEVLLPDGDGGDLEYALSEASDVSDDFVQWMQSRTHGAQAAPAAAAKKRPRPQLEAGGEAKQAAGDAKQAGGEAKQAAALKSSGGTRTQRRRASMKRRAGLAGV
uniref:Nucleoplasmin-like domain-containing protein n=1 Tax=Haptolina brevifila TaxID=156173 RepID=A0A7S2GQM9_9EUKA|mmetsp:Transcript_43604/g.87257  ORF Transcript_43604/g.87257 Transcript_43604/m.87257 type:complete len:274 (+) Transcript_43604:23-844(+)